MLLRAQLVLQTDDVLLLPKLLLAKRAQLPRALQGCLQVLKAVARAVLARLLTKLLLSVELLLRPVKRLLVALVQHVLLLHTQIALTLGLNNCLPAATKRTLANGLRLVLVAQHFRLPTQFA